MLKSIAYGVLVTLLLMLSSMGNITAQVIPEARDRHLPNLPSYEYQRLHFGFLVGFNCLDYHVYNTGDRTPENKFVARYAEVESLVPGINLGIITDLRIAKHLNLRALPGVSFGERNLTFYDEYGNKIDEDPVRIKSTYLDLPIILKYSAYRLHNVQPFVDAGTSFKYDLARDKQSHFRMKSFDTCLDVGAGVDIYLQYFRFSIELKSSFGLTNIYRAQIEPDLEDLPYQQALRSLKARVFCINFFFE